MAKESCAGSALLVVLIMFGVIAALALIISRSVSGAANELSAARATSEAQSDLRAGIELGVAAIFKLGDDMRSGDADANLPNRRIAVRVTNERARIDLNAASAEVLAGLFEASGVEKDEASSLAANVVRWRGSTSQKPTATPARDDHALAPGSLPLAGSSMTMGSESKSPSEQPSTRRYFFHPTQLVSLPGFSKAFVRTLLPFVTVANGLNQIDPFIASEGVLNALPESSPSKVEAFLSAREANTSRDTAILLLGVDKELLTSDASRGWRLQIVTTRNAGKSLRRSEAVIAVVKDDKELYRVVYVVDDADPLHAD